MIPTDPQPLNPSKIFIAARIGQPPISVLVFRLEVICLLAVPRPHCVESLRIFDRSYLVHSLRSLSTLYICHLLMRKEAFN